MSCKKTRAQNFRDHLKARDAAAGLLQLAPQQCPLSLTWKRRHLLVSVFSHRTARLAHHNLLGWAGVVSWGLPTGWVVGILHKGIMDPPGLLTNSLIRLRILILWFISFHRISRKSWKTYSSCVWTFRERLENNDSFVMAPDWLCSVLAEGSAHFCHWILTLHITLSVGDLVTWLLIRYCSFFFVSSSEKGQILEFIFFLKEVFLREYKLMWNLSNEREAKREWREWS